MVFSVFCSKNKVFTFCSYGDRKNLKTSNLEVIWKNRTLMFITSQKEFITTENSIFSMLQQQGDKLQLKLQIILLRHIG